MIKYLSAHKRVTRSELSLLSGLPDRTVRKEIEELRKNGYKIHSATDGSGYKVATTEKEFEEIKRMYSSRIEDMFDTLVEMFGYDNAYMIACGCINKTKYTG